MNHIAIIGAGPGGLLCARMLQQHGIDVTVYDADASVDARDPGGTLDLHADSGQIAIEDAGLTDQFLALARMEGQAKSSRDQHGALLHSFVPDDEDDAAPEVDRGELRCLLAESVRPGTVRWGHKLTSATPLDGARHRLEFANGTVDEVDVLIGADGAWSRVRPLLTDATPSYTGVSFLNARFTDVDHRHPEVAAVVGAGHMFSRDGQGRGIILQRNSAGVVIGYLGLRIAEDWVSGAGLELTDTAAVRDHLRECFTGWAPAMLQLLDTDDVFVNRGLYALPAPLTWAHTPGVTLLGDAAHLMTPFGGFGVNLALLDGVELAHTLHHAESTETDPEAAIDRYETAMFARSGQLAVGANRALDGFFAADGTEHRAPDHQAEHEQYQSAAASYRRATA